MYLEDETKKIKKFAGKHRKKIRSVGTFQDCCDKVVYCTSLLKRFNLTDRIIENISDIDDVMSRKIDFNTVNDYISEQKAYTKSYLVRNLRL